MKLLNFYEISHLYIQHSVNIVNGEHAHTYYMTDKWKSPLHIEFKVISFIDFFFPCCFCEVLG